MKTYTVSNGEPLQALDINAHIRKDEGYAVLDVDDRCEVTVDSGDLGQSDTLEIKPGDIIFDGDRIRVSRQSVRIAHADPNDPRKDVVYVDDNGNAKVSSGNPEASQPTNQTHGMTERPVPPDLKSTPSVVLAIIWIPAGVSTIAKSDVLDRRLFAEVTVGTADTLALDISGRRYVESGEVELITTLNGSDRRASTTSKQFVTARGLFSLHINWDNLPSSRSATAISLRTDPAQGETIIHRIYNNTDNQAVSGTDISETSSVSVHTDWARYTPSTTKGEITLVSEFRTAGGSSSEISDISLWLGRFV
ncbi:hypothetical protein [Haloplanus salinarum]|uniref:hypothetical protein n=1 Tax=Haloplanus salinarum TaxID=1912324 RepID=UPI00214BC813|nr:hypothetical protein [Haloplanus salinarum]